MRSPSFFGGRRFVRRGARARRRLSVAGALRLRGTVTLGFPRTGVGTTRPTPPGRPIGPGRAARFVLLASTRAPAPRRPEPRRAGVRVVRPNQNESISRWGRRERRGERREGDVSATSRVRRRAPRPRGLRERRLGCAHPGKERRADRRRGRRRSRRRAPTVARRCPPRGPPPTTTGRRQRGDEQGVYQVPRAQQDRKGSTRIPIQSAIP